MVPNHQPDVNVHFNMFNCIVNARDLLAPRPLEFMSRLFGHIDHAIAISAIFVSLQPSEQNTKQLEQAPA